MQDRYCYNKLKRGIIFDKHISNSNVGMGIYCLAKAGQRKKENRGEREKGRVLQQSLVIVKTRDCKEKVGYIQIR